MSTDQMRDRAERALELAKRIKREAATPREVGAEHQMAQNQLAALGVELADLMLGLDPTP